MESPDHVISRLDRWLAEHRPTYYAGLRPGLTDGQVDDFERFVGYKFPDPFRAFYRWRDGQDPFGEPFQWNRTFMSSAEVRSSWEMLTGMQEGGEWDEPQWWCRGWIPFLDNGAGSHLCLDLHGSFTGRRGQVLEFWGKDWDRPVVAPTFLSWLGWYVGSMEAGGWWVHPERGNFEEREEGRAGGDGPPPSRLRDSGRRP